MEIWPLNKKTTGIRWMLLFLACSFTSSFFAQQLSFRHLEVARKLSDLSIYKVVQDDIGFLWLGTNRGVLKYNGTDYTSVLLPDSVKNSPVRSMAHGQGFVVSGHQNGSIAIIPCNNAQKVEIRHVTGLAVNACFIDDRQNIWIGTHGVGLYILKANNEVIHLTDKKGLMDNEINSIAQCGDGIFVGTDLGLNKFNWNGDNLSTERFSMEQGLPDNLITALTTDKEGSLIIGGENGSLAKWSASEAAISVLWPESTSRSAIKKILCIEDEMWVLNESNEILVVQSNELESIQMLNIQNEVNTRESTRATDIIYDRNANLILCRGAYDLLIADCRFIYFYQHEQVPLTKIRALTCDADNNLLFATTEGIFTHLSTFREEDKLKQLLKNNFKKPFDIISLCEGPNNSIWFGTFGQGLGRFDLKTGKIKVYTEKDGLLNNNVLSIALQGDVLWVATLGGLSKITFGKKIQFDNIDNHTLMGTGYIYNVFVDAYNRVWVATDGKGAAVLQENRFDFLRTRFTEMGKSMVTITEDPLGNIWFNSTDKGIQKFNGNDLTTISISNQNKRPEVYAMQSDAYGDMVIFTSVGIGIVPKGQTTMQYISTDDAFASEYLNVSTRDKSGQVWMSSNDFLMRYRELSHLIDYQPKTVLEQVNVMLQPIDTSIHSFAYDQNYFEFHTAGFWYRQPELVRYQYKLEGFDLDWVDTRDHVISFPKLPPGKYTFRVRAANGPDWENATICTYSFVIKPAVWRQWWFILLIIVSAIALIALVILLRLRSIRRKVEFQRERIQGQFETLRNQVNPHFLFNSFNTLITIIEKDQDEAIDYVQKLSDYFRIILQQRDKDVITLGEELELVRTYLFLQRKRFGENLISEIHVDEAYLNSLIPPLSLQILVENVIKHNIITRSRPLTLRISSTLDNCIEVSNTLQEKTIKEASTGVGLSNIRNRYQVLFGKEITVLRTENEFLVSLPIVEQIS